MPRNHAWKASRLTCSPACAACTHHASSPPARSGPAAPRTHAYFRTCNLNALTPSTQPCKAPQCSSRSRGEEPARTQYNPPRWLCECTKSRLSSHTPNLRSYSCALGLRQHSEFSTLNSVYRSPSRGAPARPLHTPSQTPSPNRRTHTAGSPARTARHVTAQTHTHTLARPPASSRHSAGYQRADQARLGPLHGA